MFQFVFQKSKTKQQQSWIIVAMSHTKNKKSAWGQQSLRDYFPWYAAYNVLPVPSTLC